MFKPLEPRFNSKKVKIQKLAVINGGYFALGTYATVSGGRALFAFRFLDSGFLDLGYGPLRDGTVRATGDGRYNLVSIGPISVESNLIVCVTAPKTR